jgi:hypothetical protein
MTEHNTETEIALLRQDMDAMKDDLKAARAEVKELLDAWRTATGMLVFIKWLSTLGVAVAAFWALLKGKFGV